MHSFMTLIAVAFLIWLPGDSPTGLLMTQASESGTPGTIEMKVRGVTIDQNTQQPVVLLVDMKEKKGLPIWIGTNEARAIAMEIEGVSTPRPLTHDLIMNILTGLQTTLEKITITDLKENTFYALLSLKGKKGSITIDSRPSDAIALALRVKAPIFVAQKVMKEAQMINLVTELPQEKWEEKFGFHIQELTPELSEYFRVGDAQGVLVVEVNKESPGEKSGLRQGDIITAVDDSSVSTLDGLTHSLAAHENSHTMKVLREGRPLSITLSP